MPKYKIFFSKPAIQELKKITEYLQVKIKEKIQNLSQNVSMPSVKKIKGKPNLYRLRVGNYRVVFEKQDDKLIIIIIRIRHRKDIYRNL